MEKFSLIHMKDFQRTFRYLKNKLTYLLHGAESFLRS